MTNSILIAGAGAIGSNLTARLASDLKGYEITVLDKDVVEERNIAAGTQFYMPNQIGVPKVEALQFNIYKQFQKDISIFYGDIQKIIGSYPKQDLIIDCVDNYNARNIIQTQYRDFADLLHIGFSDQFTFAIEWAENYKVPSDITTGFDICEMEGASAFVNLVSSLGALVTEEYLNSKKKIEIIGSKFNYSIIK